MSLSKSKCLYSNNCICFFKCAVPLICNLIIKVPGMPFQPILMFVGKTKDYSSQGTVRGQYFYRYRVCGTSGNTEVRVNKLTAAKWTFFCFYL
jgi:hypothetical protein